MATLIRNALSFVLKHDFRVMAMMLPKNLSGVFIANGIFAALALGQHATSPGIALREGLLAIEAERGVDDNISKPIPYVTALALAASNSGDLLKRAKWLRLALVNDPRSNELFLRCKSFRSGCSPTNEYAFSNIRTIRDGVTVVLQQEERILKLATDEDYASCLRELSQFQLPGSTDAEMANAIEESSQTLICGWPLAFRVGTAFAGKSNTSLPIMKEACGNLERFDRYYFLAGLSLAGPGLDSESSEDELIKLSEACLALEGDSWWSRNENVRVLSSHAVIEVAECNAFFGNLKQASAVLNTVLSKCSSWPVNGDKIKYRLARAYLIAGDKTRASECFGSVHPETVIANCKEVFCSGILNSVAFSGDFREASKLGVHSRNVTWTTPSVAEVSSSNALYFGYGSAMRGRKWKDLIGCELNEASKIELSYAAAGFILAENEKSRWHSIRDDLR